MYEFGKESGEEEEEMKEGGERDEGMEGDA